MMVEELIRNCARGNQSSFEQLYRKLQRPMLAYAMGILGGDREAAEDAVDEAFADIWRAASGYSGTGSGEGWIRRIVRNKAIDWLRSQKGKRTEHWSESMEQHADAAPNPEELAMLSSDSAWLRKGLSRLNVEQREALFLCYFEERPLAEIATMMSCPENTVKTRLFHARLGLRKQFGEMSAAALN